MLISFCYIFKRLKNLRGTVLCSTWRTKCFRSYHQPSPLKYLWVYSFVTTSTAHTRYTNYIHVAWYIQIFFFLSFLTCIFVLRLVQWVYSKHNLMNSANMFCSAAWYQYKSGTVQSSSAENFSTIKCQQLVYAFFVTFEITKPTLNSLQHSKVRKAIYTCSVFVKRKMIAVTQEKATHKRCLRAVK